MTAIIIPFPAQSPRAPATDHQLNRLVAVGRELVVRLDDGLLEEWLAAVCAYEDQLFKTDLSDQRVSHYDQ